MEDSVRRLEGILVSEMVRTVGDSLAGVKFRDAGRKQLKGTPRRQRVQKVVR